MTKDLVDLLRKEVEIRRRIPSAFITADGELDLIANVLEEAAEEIEKLREAIKMLRGRPVFWNKSDKT
mgnify:CR=1 FL=1